MAAFPIIDADGHVEPALAVDWSRYMPVHGRAFTEQAQKVFKKFNHAAPPLRGGWDPEMRLVDMDTEGIDIAVIFGGGVGLRTDRPGFFAEEETDYPLEIAQGYNNWLYEYCNAAPDRLKGIALIPYEEPEAGLKEIRRAIRELGFVGVLQKCAFRNLSPADPYFDPFYRELELLDVPLMIHIGNDRLQHFLLGEMGYGALWWHGLGNPMSMMLAVTDILCKGVLEKFPRLRVAFLEGQAGWLPWLLEHLDELYELRPGDCPLITKKPSAYVESGQFFISADSRERQIPLVANTVSEDILLYNSDYPHFDGSFPGSIAPIRENAGLSERQKRKMLSENAARLLSGPARDT